MCEIYIRGILEFEEIYIKKLNEKEQIKRIKWNVFLRDFKNDNPDLKYPVMLKQCSINYKKLKARIL